MSAWQHSRMSPYHAKLHEYLINCSERCISLNTGSFRLVILA